VCTYCRVRASLTARESRLARRDSSSR
jgi:hypothetical protein